MIEHVIEQGLAFGLRHVGDAHRHQPIDVDRLAAGVLVGSKGRMRAFGEGDGAAAVAFLRRAVIVVVHRPPALQLAADCGIEGVVGGIAAGEQRVAAR